MEPDVSHAETGWLPDLIYTDGRFQSGVAMFADGAGNITRFSTNAGDIARTERLPGRAMLPGLVNGHSHAFQRVLRGRTEGRSASGGGSRDSFWTWRGSMYHAAERFTPEELYQASRMAFLEMLLSGITTVGEFHYLHHRPGGAAYADRNELAWQVIRAAQDVGLRIALLRTAYVRAGWNKAAEPAQARFVTSRAEDFIADTEALRRAIAQSDLAGRVWVGIAPHSLRAVPLEYAQDAVAYARSQQMPVHMHVSEQPADVEACLAEYKRRPIDLLDEKGLLDERFTAVHAIHITEEEISALAGAKSMVCACPTTERNLGDGAVPADRLLKVGVPISLGSDSNVQIQLLEDARELEYHLRMLKLERAVIEAKELFRCATVAGAASVGGSGGELAPGRQADFFTIALDDPSVAGTDPESLLATVVFSAERGAVRDVAIGGRFVVREGRHARTGEIVEAFGRVQKELWA